MYMQVFPELSVNAWRVLIGVVERGGTASEVAARSNLSLSRVSEAVDALEKAGVIRDRSRRKRLVADASLKTVVRDLLTHCSEESLVRGLEKKKR